MKRNIRAEEKTLIQFLLYSLELNLEDYHITEQVEEYGDVNMGSIGLAIDSNCEYDSDLIQVEYIDSDNTPVVITLTQDKQNRLLDLDFWKTDFTALITYPKPEQLIIKS